nr:MAG TPA: hypothetical protein [Caudoviricetes sp.]
MLAKNSFNIFLYKKKKNHTYFYKKFYIKKLYFFLK